jgi:hypothetical protein
MDEAGIRTLISESAACGKGPSPPAFPGLTSDECEDDKGPFFDPGLRKDTSTGKQGQHWIRYKNGAMQAPANICNHEQVSA